MPRVAIADLHDRVAFCDPAAGKTELRKTLARSAIVVLAQDWMGRVFCLYAWAARCPTDTLIDKIFEVNRNWAPRTFGVEANGLQVIFGDYLKRDARIQAVRLPIEPVPQPTNLRKEFRNRVAIQRPLGEGRLFVPKEFTELRHELGVHPMSPIKDLVDAYASAINLLKKQAPLLVEDQESLAFAKYLRRHNVPPAAIERRVEEYKAKRRNARPALEIRGIKPVANPELPVS